MIMQTFAFPCEFFTTVLADGHLLESEQQQVSSGLQDSSQYSSRLLLLLASFFSQALADGLSLESD